MTVRVKPYGSPECQLSQPRAAQLEMQQPQGLETGQVPGVYRQAVLITCLGLVPLFPVLVNGSLQIQDEV